MSNTISGGAGSETLNGLSGDNLISGGDGADKLNGGASADTLDGGAGSDTVSGNSGDDLLVFDARTAAATLDVYDGGSGKDTLKLVLTFDQWFSTSVQAELANHLNFVLVNTQWRTLEANNAEFNFTSLGVGLRTSKIENLRVVAGGVDVGDVADEAVTIVADSTEVSEETSGVSMNVLANDLVPDLVKSLTFTQPGAYPAKGGVTLEGGPFVAGSTAAWLKYTPVAGAWDFLAAGATATETFNYTVVDADGDTDTKSVTIKITGVNDGPVAVADTAAGGENQTLTIDVLANDTDADEGHVFTLLSGSAPAGKGSASVVAGQLVFDPGTAFDHLKAGATEVVTLNYQMKDDQGATSGSTVAVTITGVNDGPVAVADTAAGGENQTLAIDVLANDTDLDDDHVFTLVGGSAPAGKGSVSVAGAQLVFDPGGDFDHLKAGATEVVTLNYQMKDDQGATSSSTVAVTITGVNDGPVAVADTAAGGENQTLTIDVLANDTDADDDHVFTLLSGSAPAGKGSASVVAGQLVFDPGTAFDHLKAGATEVVTLNYQMKDDQGATSGSTVAVTITGVNDGPVAVADTAAGGENQTLTIDVMANDTDLDDDHVFTLVGGSAPAGKGSVSVAGAQLVFDPGADFDHLKAGATEVVTLNYQMKDDQGATSSSTVAVTVTGVNDGPVAVADTAAGGENQTLTIDVLANDTDADDDHVFTLLSGSAPAGKGSASVVAGQLVFDPGADFDHLKAGATEVVTLNYQMKDDQGVTSGSTVAVTITGVNDGPVAVADSGSATEAGSAAGSNATGDVLANDTDVDVGDAKTVSLVKFGGVEGVVGSELSGAYGKLTLNADGGYTYAVDNDDPAVDALRLATDTLVEIFTYRVKDGGGAESEATLTITIHGANDPAVFTSGATGSVAENAPISTVAYDAAVTDVDGLAAVFSLSGADAGLFNIDAATGEVTFKVSPNFEAPGDAGGDNVYDIEVKAFDGQATTTRAVSITVTNANEAPSITSNGADATASVSVAENTTAVATVTAADPDAATTLTYSIVGGADQSKFDINPTTGALAFVTAPNFEAPTDVGANNTYEVQVKASDGELDDVQTLTVTVTDVQENAAPTAVADTVIMSAGTNPAIFLASALLANDTDPELDTLQIVGASGSGVSFNPGTGLITLTDPAITSFTYEMKDATNASVTGTVTVQKVTVGGGNANDTINISGFTYAASYIDVANGADSVTGGGGVNWFLGGSGADLMIGSGANDTLSGEQDNDRLTGNGGADNLVGAAGNDTLTGGAGDDILRGDNGADRFVFTSLGDGGDTIQDFAPSTTSQPDRIDLSAIDAVPGGADNAFAFVAVQNAGTVANSVTWQVVGGVTFVRIDTDGVSGAELTIALAGAPNLSAGDFIL